MAMVIAASAMVFGTGTAAATDNQWLSFPGGFAPGAAFGQLNSAETKIGACTLSYVVKNPEGHVYGLTAGHCDRGSSWNPRLFYTKANNPDVGVPLGTFAFSQRRSEVDGHFPFTTDVAAIDFKPGSDLYSSRVAGVYRVADVVRDPSQLRPGMELCKYGMRTEETCGPITKVEHDSVTADVYSLEGDSGAPAYIKLGNDKIAAVGILSGSPVGDDNVTEFYYVAPVIKAMNVGIVAGNG